MQNFQIEVTETLTRIIPVEAETAQEALEFVRQARKDGDIVLDYSDLLDTEYVVGVNEEPLITALLIEPNKPPIQVEIDSALSQLQRLVGGLIEVTTPFEDPVAIICNEEGKINHLPLNRAVYDDEGKLHDVIAGTFLIVGEYEFDFVSLNSSQLEKYSKMFETPDKFQILGGKIAVQKVKPPKQKQPHKHEFSR